MSQILIFSKIFPTKYVFNLWKIFFPISFSQLLYYVHIYRLCITTNNEKPLFLNNIKDTLEKAILKIRHLTLIRLF